MDCEGITQIIKSIYAESEELAQLSVPEEMLQKQEQINSLIKECKKGLWQIREVTRYDFGEGEVLDLAVNTTMINFIQKHKDGRHEIVLLDARFPEDSTDLSPYMEGHYYTDVSPSGVRYTITFKERKYYVFISSGWTSERPSIDSISDQLTPICICAFDRNNVLIGEYGGISNLNIDENRLEDFCSDGFGDDVVVTIIGPKEHLIVGTSLGKIHLMEGNKVISSFSAFEQKPDYKHLISPDEIAYTSDYIMTTTNQGKKTVVFDYAGNKMAEIDETGKVVSLGKYLILSESRMLYIFDPDLEEFIEINLATNEDWQPTSIDVSDNRIYIGTNTGKVIAYSKEEKVS